MRIRHCNNVMDFRQIARRKLPAPVFHYLDGGAGCDSVRKLGRSHVRRRG